MERPGVQVLGVFTACSCRLSYVRQPFEADDSDMVLFREVDDSTAHLVVLVSHPALFFVVQFLDRLQFLLLTEFFPLHPELAFHVLVLASVPEEPRLFAIGRCDGRDFQTEVHPEHVGARLLRRANRDGDLGDPFLRLPRDAQRPELVGEEGGVPVVRVDHLGADGRLLHLPVDDDREGDRLEVERVVLVVPGAVRFLEDRDDLEVLLLRPLEHALRVLDGLVLDGARQVHRDMFARQIQALPGLDHGRDELVRRADVGVHHPLQDGLLRFRRMEFDVHGQCLRHGLIPLSFVPRHNV